MLLIDVKIPANTTWPLVMAQLAPLRERQFLTREERISVSPGFATRQSRWPGPVTVVGTGSLDKQTLIWGPRAYPARRYWDYHDTFIDAPLETLSVENLFYHGTDDRGQKWTGACIMWSSEGMPFVLPSRGI